jgi:hypothetical protein
MIGMAAATIRSDRRHARAGMRALTELLEQDPHGLMLRRAYTDMRDGDPCPPGEDYITPLWNLSMWITSPPCLRSRNCRRLIVLTCGFAAGNRRSRALIPACGRVYLRTGQGGVEPAGQPVSQRAVGSAR